ncbi:MAG: hypothetical protein JXR25_00800 [Pontiellaceae bacterium]|nr:hypothetical protein [Pontiellaceae bacterium]MBN2783337.1 hypothetical protein [Pontiellaceae bacterium]
MNYFAAKRKLTSGMWLLGSSGVILAVLYFAASHGERSGQNSNVLGSTMLILLGIAIFGWAGLLAAFGWVNHLQYREKHNYHEVRAKRNEKAASQAAARNLTESA